MSGHNWQFGDWGKTKIDGIVRCAAPFETYIKAVNREGAVLRYEIKDVEYLPNCTGFDYQPEPEIPPVPEGYRILSDDEPVQADDIRVDGTSDNLREEMMKLGESVRIGNESYLVTSITKNETGLMIVSFEVEGKIHEGYRILGDDEVIEEGDMWKVASDRDWKFKCAGAVGMAVKDAKKNWRSLGDLVFGRRILQLREGAYYERKDGKIVGPCVRNAHPDYPWRVEYAYTNEGKFYADGRPDRTDLVREVPRPEPKYRPFANAEEFDPHKDRWVLRLDGSGKWRPTAFTNTGVFSSDEYDSYEQSFKLYKFADDNSPFGVKE